MTFCGELLICCLPDKRAIHSGGLTRVYGLVSVVGVYLSTPWRPERMPFFMTDIISWNVSILIRLNGCTRKDTSNYPVYGIYWSPYRLRLAHLERCSDCAGLFIGNMHGHKPSAAVAIIEVTPSVWTGGASPVVTTSTVLGAHTHSLHTAIIARGLGITAGSLFHHQFTHTKKLSRYLNSITHRWSVLNGLP